MSMKRSFVGFVAFALAGVAMGGTCVWTGASGNWSNAANWRDGVVPVAGDTVYVSNTVGNVSINLDPADGVSLASIRFEGASPVELTGHELRLTGGWSFKSYPGMSGQNVMVYEESTFPFFTWTSAVDVRVPVVLDSKGTTGLSSTTNTVHFHETVSAPEATTLYIHNGFNANKDEVAAGVPAGFKSAYTYFHGDLLAPKAKFQSNQAPCGFVYCYGRLHVKDMRFQSWASCRLFLYSNDNVWESVMADYGNFYMAMGENVFPANSVFQLGDVLYATNEGGYNLGNYNQVIDRLDGTPANVEKAAALAGGQYLRSNSNYSGGQISTPTTLTMKGTADGTTTLIVIDQISLVWDPVGDYALTFTNRASTTTGSLTVKRGTFRLAGDASFAKVSAVTVGADATVDLATTAAGALASASTISLGANARLKVGSGASAPFAPTALVTLMDGARFVLAEGANVAVAAVCSGTNFLPDGTYTSANADWIEGAGSVTIAAGGTCIWKQAASGRWAETANWVNGRIPDATSSGAFILVNAASDYAVTVDQPVAAFPTNLVVQNLGGGTASLVFAADAQMGEGTIRVGKGGCVRVDEGATFAYTGIDAAVFAANSYTVRQRLAARPMVTVEAGGEWLIAGGTTDFTNIVGVVSLAGTDEEPARWTMTDGVFAYMDNEALSPFTVAKGGVLDLRGGTFRLPHHGYNHITDLATRGGTVLVSNTVIDTAGKFVTPNGGSIYFGTGDTVFDTGAQLRLAGGNKFVSPAAAGETARLTYRNGAAFPNYNTNFRWYIGGFAGGTGIFDWAADDSVQQNPFAVGYDDGEGVLNVKRGLLRVHSYGLSVAQQYSTSKTPSASVVGRVSVDAGAAVYIEGSLNKGWGASSTHCGLIVGDGANAAAVSGRPYVGYMQVAGAVTNNMGQVIIGLGPAEGTYVQQGGISMMNNGLANGKDEAGNAFAYHGHTVLGQNGGIGRVIVSNGTFKVVRGTLFVGGCSTDEFCSHSNDANRERNAFVGTARYPFDRHDGTGTFTVAGGETVVNHSTVLGADGAGVLEMRGSVGTFTTKDLVLSNATESVVRFVADANGVSPVAATGTLTVTDATRLEVDLSAYTGKAATFPLVTFGAFEGDLSQVDLSFTDGSGRSTPCTLVKDEHAIRFAFTCGTVLLLR